MAADYNIEATLAFTLQKFQMIDPVQAAYNSGSSWQEGHNYFMLPFLGKRYTITYPQGRIKGPDDKEPELQLRIIMLHYLSHAQDVSLVHEWISFRDLPGGNIYMEPFTKRAIKPMVEYFGNQPQTLVKASSSLGGRSSDIGDFSVVLKVFPRVLLALVLWEGDEEFPPSGNILFDGSAAYFLPTEDYAIICEYLVRLLKNIKTR